MYGSQFQAEQALTIIRPDTQELARRPYTQKKSNPSTKKSICIATLVLIALSVSSLSYAGSSQPKLKGGNGNANGR